jgi:hypothetical protein
LGHVNIGKKQVDCSFRGLRKFDGPGSVASRQHLEVGAPEDLCYNFENPIVIIDNQNGFELPRKSLRHVISLSVIFRTARELPSANKRRAARLA